MAFVHTEKQQIEWDEDDRPIWVHECTGRTERVQLPLGAQLWQADRATDTVTPSLSCSECNMHGWWSQGKFWSA